MVIRGETIKYSSKKKKETEKEEIDLGKQMKILEDKLNDNLLSINENDLNLLEVKENRVEEIKQKKKEGVMLRSRGRYTDLGEKRSK